MSDHTPGPWLAVCDESGGSDCEWGIKANGYWIASFYFSGADEAGNGTAERNARLCAAAPAMLKALECLIVGACAVACPNPSERAVLQEAVDIARAAIKAAKGEA